jgi:hypothetical protein
MAEKLPRKVLILQNRNLLARLGQRCWHRNLKNTLIK